MNALIATNYPIPCHIQAMLFGELAYNLVGKEGTMAARTSCCRYEPSLEELLDDEMMTPVLRSAGFDADAFREMIAETARRLDLHEPRSAGFAE